MSWVTDCAIWEGVVAPVSPIEYTDDFNRSDSTNLGANWAEFGSGDFTIDTNQLRNTSAFGRFGMWTSPVSAADQYVAVDSVSHGSETYLVLRASAANISSGGYYAGANGANWVIGKMGVGNIASVGGASGQLGGGVRLTFEASGNNLTLKRNGVTVISTTDATSPSGLYAGLYLAGANTARLDNFELGVL